MGKRKLGTLPICSCAAEIVNRLLAIVNKAEVRFQANEFEGERNKPAIIVIVLDNQNRLMHWQRFFKG